MGVTKGRIFRIRNTTLIRANQILKYSLNILLKINEKRTKNIEKRHTLIICVRLLIILLAATTNIGMS